MIRTRSIPAGEPWNGPIRCVVAPLLMIVFAVAGGAPAAVEEPDVRASIAGDARLDERAYALLAGMLDRYGARMIGTEGHRRSLDALEEALEAIGVATRRQTFEFPGWVRGVADVRMLEPTERVIRTAALGYVEGAGPIEALLGFADQRSLDDLSANRITDRVLLIPSRIRYSPKELKDLAERFNVRGGLMINRVDGGQLLARTANFHGDPPPFPLFTITREEGLWMQRLMERGEPVRVRLETSSRNKTMRGTNLIVRFPGRSGQRVVVGGHFDSWDLGQGAMDNGLGVAQIYEVARLLQMYAPENRHGVDLVWFDAEEFGLWGSRHYVNGGDLGNVRVMLNLDMVGRPIAINAMGFVDLIPSLESYQKSLGSLRLEKGVINEPWVASDHTPFMLAGVPSITFNAPIDPDAVRYYHDLADTMDKIDRSMLDEASALIALLVYHLANDDGEAPEHLDSEETARLFRDAGLEEQMRRAGTWPADDPE